MSLMDKIPIGTKSLLYGAHCWFIHPLFVWAAWSRLYGPVADFRLIVAFFVHDWGYWGRHDMDGAEGKGHPIAGAMILHDLFDGAGKSEKWFDFCLYHSRHAARVSEVEPSPLCWADKYAFCLEPWWFYLPRVILTGEINEFMSVANDAKCGIRIDTKRHWHEDVSDNLRRHVSENWICSSYFEKEIN